MLSLSLLLCETGNPADAGADGHVLLNPVALHRGHGGGPAAGALVERPGGTTTSLGSPLSMFR